MRLYLIILLCFASGLCQSQDQKFIFGPKVGGGLVGWHREGDGLGYPSATVERKTGNRFVPGYVVGVFGKYYLTSRVSINVSALYVRGGSKLVDNISGELFL